MDALSRTLTLPSLEAKGYPLKLALMHLWRNGYVPDLRNPRTFNELVQARKLHDRDPLLPLFADKVKVKEVVAQRLGPEWLIPTLWHGKVLPDAPQWPLPFVLKSSHACNQCIFVRSGGQDWGRIRRRAQRWLGGHYGGILDEWLYARIEPQLLVEPFIGREGALPTDYKFFVFGGRAEFVQVDTDREHSHKRVLLDRNWRRLPAELQFPMEKRDVPPPASLPAMLEAAEALSRGFDFVRVDLYEVEGRPLFGEMSFYPGSGLDRFKPVSFDALFGEYWLEARRQRPSW
jgi:hypothetical protein